MSDVRSWRDSVDNGDAGKRADELRERRHAERGIPMKLLGALGLGGDEPVRPARPSRRRNVAVRLCDIREEVRLEAARQIALQEKHDAVTRAVYHAARFPSRKVYFVSQAAAATIQDIAA